MSIEIEVKAWAVAGTPGDDGFFPETRPAAAQCPAVEDLKNRLSALGHYRGAYDKRDTYWVPADQGTRPPVSPSGPAEDGAVPPLRVRIRRECESGEGGPGISRILVTYKASITPGEGGQASARPPQTESLEQPRTYAGIEVNDEREFNIRPEEGAGGGSGRKGEIEPPDRGLRAFEELLRRLGLRPALSKRKRGWAWDCGEIRAELSHVESLGWFIELEILREPEPPAGEGDSPGNPGGSTDQDAMAACRDKLLALLDRLEIPRSRIESRPYTRMLAGIRPR